MITEKSTFNEVFGDYREAYTEEERKDRWEKFKAATSKAQVKLLTNSKECDGCLHLDAKESWCNSCGLPCTVNPVFGFSMIGMACMGLEHTLQQTELFTSDLFSHENGNQ